MQDGSLPAGRLALAADVAKALDTTVAKLNTAYSDARKAEAKQRVDAALAAGNITEKYATELKAEIDDATFPGFGPGGGRRSSRVRIRRAWSRRPGVRVRIRPPRSRASSEGRKRFVGADHVGVRLRVGEPSDLRAAGLVADGARSLLYGAANAAYARWSTSASSSLSTRKPLGPEALEDGADRHRPDRLQAPGGFRPPRGRRPRRAGRCVGTARLGRAAACCPAAAPQEQERGVAVDGVGDDVAECGDVLADAAAARRRRRCRSVAPPGPAERAARPSRPSSRARAGATARVRRSPAASIRLPAADPVTAAHVLGGIGAAVIAASYSPPPEPITIPVIVPSPIVTEWT